MLFLYGVRLRGWSSQFHVETHPHNYAALCIKIQYDFVISQACTFYGTKSN
jgi:hypothetical protein